MLEDQKRRWRCSPLAGRLKAQKKPMLLFESKGRKKANVLVWGPAGRRHSLLFQQGSAFGSSQAFNGLDEAHPP